MIKFKKPERVAMYKCSSGAPVETLPLWQRSELDAKLIDAIIDDGTRACVVDLLVDRADEFVAILALKENGRPNGAKDKSKRKTKAEKAADAATTAKAA